ncbi:MAG: TlpA family protein disulfide reductase [Calditrichaeota bacterium]|nr:MAG: TlpA family protein disulfide reductase [Calditrichota bacterium]MBL1208140.1 TlpA family protein disulfide reductase [Calditrichota bacterium]NOG47978.1 TlpA family protein disulfide reductase [Calditrichota bacterium]
MIFYIIALLSILPIKSISTETPEIKFGQKSYIKITQLNKNTPSKCKIDFWAFIPPERRVYDTEISNKRNTIIDLDINFPKRALVTIDTLPRFSVYIIPDDTLEIIIDFSKDIFADAISFKGENTLPSKFLFNKQTQFKKGKLRLQIASEKIPLLEVKAKMDSMTNEEIYFLDNFNKNQKLPNWFYVNQKWSFIYWNADRKALAANYRRDVLKFKETIPDNYFDFWKELPFVNMDAKLTFNYYQYISSYFYYNILPDNYKWKDKKSQYEGILKYYPASAYELLNTDLAEIFLCYEFGKIINDGFFDLFDSEIEKNKKYFKNPNILEILTNFRENKFAPKVGEQAFNFYLPDENNQFHELKDFHNKIVLLNFWFHGCSGCVIEVPFEKELINKFSNNEFEIINIHMIDNKESWLSGLKKYQLDGVNLFANTNWIQLLRKNYSISGYPTYVLIDKDGTIINPNSARPSKGLEKEIKNYISY